MSAVSLCQNAPMRPDDPALRLIREMPFGKYQGRLIADLPIPFEFPRSPELRGTAEFARLAAEVSSLLRRATP